MQSNREAKASTIALVYFGYFAALGISGPFLARYLETWDLSVGEIASLMAVLPVARILATPGWTYLADRLHSASVVLRLVAVGAVCSFAILLFPIARIGLIASLLLFTIFRAPVTSLLDVLALQWSSRTGGEFGRLRVWGTAGFTLAVMVAGIIVNRWGPRAIVPSSVALLFLTALGACFLPSAPPPERVRLLPAVMVLVRRPRFVMFLVTAALHQVGLGAYDAFFGTYVTHLSNATYGGIAIAFGATAEAVFMTVAAGSLKTRGLTRTLVLAYGASALRWLLTAFVTRPWVLILAQGFHALTFGAFYLAAVALVDEESPREVRASAQGVFGAWTWGVANAGALALGGALQKFGGMRLVFIAGAIASSIATLIMAAMNSNERRASRIV